MTDERRDVEPGWKEVRRIFEAVAELDPGQRQRALESACGGDDALRAAVDSLLRSDSDLADSFLDPLSPEHISERLDEEWAQGLLGTRIGAYQLQRILGAGGMGLVFEAVQKDPERTVAVKVMRPGAVSDRAFARFREEAAMLGKLQHPAVAQVIEAGLEQTARGGVPWFAMLAIPNARDLVTYAEQEELDDDGRIELLRKVLDGVQHGHLRGVIHCDLKPANLLVDENGWPHVIDFGVARLAAPSGGSSGSTHGPAGTWRYMAPEQLSQESPDLRADVYALGVVLYELLCGAAPLEFQDSTSSAERAHVLRNSPPTPPRQRRPNLPADLEWIMLKALAKDPVQRYASVAALGDDLDRQRRGFPVEAAPGSGLYRARKFVGRNRRLVALAAGLVALLAGSTAMVLSSYKQAAVSSREAAENYQRAAEEGQRASALYRFLVNMLVEPLRETVDGDDVRFVDVISRSADQIEARFETVPRVRGELHVLYGNIYGGLWKNEQAVEHMQQGLELMREELDPHDPELFRILSDLGDVLTRSGRMSEAEPLLREALYGPGDLPERTRLALLVNLTTLYLDLHQLERAEPVAREAFEFASELLPEDNALRLTAESNWAAILEYGRGDHEGAARLLERIVQAVPRSPRDRHPDVMRAKVNLAVVYGRTGRLEECSALLREALTEQRRVFSPGHPATCTTLLNLAQLEESLGDLEEAEALRRERLDALRLSLAPDAPALIASVTYHGEWLIEHGRPADALAFWRDDLELRGARLDRASPTMLKLRWRAARLLLDLEHSEQAAEELAQVLEDHQDLPPSPQREEDTAVMRLALGRALLELERAPQAEPYLGKARAWVEEHAPDDTGEALDARLWHGRALLVLERDDEARACLEPLTELLAAHPSDPRGALVASWLAELDARE